MGFSNNPDELTTIFSGIVAELEGTEIMTIRAQGFLSELMTPAPDKIGHDTWWSTHSLLSVFALRKSPRFGGAKIWGHSGDAGAVMQKMIEVPTAKHFGHWQVGKPIIPYMKGFDWEALTGSALTALGSTRVGLMLQSGSDRSGENILVNQVSPSCRAKAASRRGLETQKIS